MLLDRPGPWMLTYGDHKRMRELYDHPGVKLMPIVYAGNVNASRKDGRTDLIIGMAAK
ncbi:MAG TPA: hypothetical protein QGH10_21390 [Armatimonadota bacterium]|nr:hypothetical protein [Armatimonadota bacterium]